MLNINQALNLISGDMVYNNRGEQLIIQDYRVKFLDGSIQTIIFGCLNSRQQKYDYPYYHLFMSRNNITNDCVSFIKWSVDHVDILDKMTHKELDLIKKVYCDGFKDRLKYLAEEQLQK